MALRVELDKTALVDALEVKIASFKRSMNSAKQPHYKALYEKDIATLQNAINTLTENK